MSFPNFQNPLALSKINKCYICGDFFNYFNKDSKYSCISYNSFTLYEVDDTKCLICENCQFYYYCEKHKTIDNCESVINQKCDVKNCNEKIKVRKPSVFIPYSTRPEYEDISLYCKNHSYYCLFNNVKFKDVCYNRCKNKFINLNIYNLDFIKVPPELKYIILDLSRKINGCGKH